MSSHLDGEAEVDVAAGDGAAQAPVLDGLLVQEDEDVFLGDADLLDAGDELAVKSALGIDRAAGEHAQLEHQVAWAAARRDLEVLGRVLDQALRAVVIGDLE